MYFDWITWGIWLIGFAILVFWIWFPLKEFKQILMEVKKTKEKSKEDGGKK